jgi:hypothetical protein
MTARPVSRRSPFARAVYLHLGVDLFGQLHAKKPGEAMQKNSDIRRLSARFSGVACAERLLEFIHLAARARDEHGEIARFAKRGVAPVADGLAGFAIHRFHLDVIPAGAERSARTQWLQAQLSPLGSRSAALCAFTGNDS